MNEHSLSVQRMFSDIAAFYIRLNTIMTFGLDRVYRRESVCLLKPAGGCIYLDDGAGTGDFSIEILQQSPQAQVVALDFTKAMIDVGCSRENTSQILWVVGDSLNLPFKDQTFHGAVSGFLMRNVTSVDDALKEQARALKPGGVSVILDTSPPLNNFLRPFILVYYRLFIPLMGFIFAGNISAYRYLPRSTEHFLNPAQLKDKMEHAGFKSVHWFYRLFGNLAIHSAQK